MPKQHQTKLESIKLFFWDPRTKKCMGRTADSWLKIVAFYIALYAILAAVWSLFFYMFQQTISDRYPKWQLDESLIGSNPGLGFRPQNPPHRIDSALISYKTGKDGDHEHWVQDLNNYLEGIPFEFITNSRKNGSLSKQDCGPERDKDSFCPFDTSIIPPECSAASNYSFNIGQPCILIKINRIYGWRPIPYEKKPPGFPKGAIFTPNVIPITCEGQNDFDKEHLGEIAYHPAYIDSKYYPFYNQPGYQSPFVMVQFKSLKYNTLIYVECKAWAKNIDHNRFNKRGSTSFELFIEKPVAEKQ